MDIHNFIIILLDMRNKAEQRLNSTLDTGHLQILYYDDIDKLSRKIKLNTDIFGFR